jgi:hypothetical protein
MAASNLCWTPHILFVIQQGRHKGVVHIHAQRYYGLWQGDNQLLPRAQEKSVP